MSYLRILFLFPVPLTKERSTLFYFDHFMTVGEVKMPVKVCSADDCVICCVFFAYILTYGLVSIFFSITSTLLADSESISRRISPTWQT